MTDLIIYEAGVRNPEGAYSEFMVSPDRDKVLEYLEIMRDVVQDGFEIVFLKKTYSLTSTTPHIYT